MLTEMDIADRIKGFMDCLGRLYSFDSELTTPEYAYRMWGGELSMEDIENGLMELRKNGYTLCGTTDSRSR